MDDWTKGFAVLTAYKAGTYTPGMEADLTGGVPSGSSALIDRVLADYSILKNGSEQEPEGKTFSDVYKEFYAYKFERDKSREYSKSTEYIIKAAYKNCSVLHEKQFRNLRHDDLQGVVDSCTLSNGSKSMIINLLHQIYAYAEVYELCDKDYSKHVKINTADDTEHGEAFTEKELKILWKNKDNEIVEFLLIMCYSGYRIAAYQDLKVDLTKKYFQGGVKTSTSKGRVVPIHSAILPLVNRRMKRSGSLLDCIPGTFRKKMYKTLEEIGIQRHTPHDCRHTFSALCEKYKVNENDRKRMLGHAFGSDITNRVYGHREVEDLREEIEKIKVL